MPDAEKGTVVWSIDLNVQYKIQARDRDANRMPIWGMACSPLIYNDLVILQIGAKDASAIALDKKTGKEVWRALSDPGQYSSPVLTKQAGKDVLVCWTGASVAGLAPQNGEVYWRQEFLPKNMPIMIGEHVYGVDSYGELRCLNADTGERTWEDLTAVPKARWSTIHFVQNGDRVWMFNERGELIISKLTPAGFQEISRAKLIEPTTEQLRDRGVFAGLIPLLP